jgi:hypothetical protein
MSGRAGIFIADKVNARPTTEYCLKAAALVAREFTVPEVGKPEMMYVDTISGPFWYGDYLQIQWLDTGNDLEVQKIWFRIIIVYSLEDQYPLQNSWLVEHLQGGRVGTVIEPGCAVINYGRPANELG